MTSRVLSAKIAIKLIQPHLISVLSPCIRDYQSTPMNCQVRISLLSVAAEDRSRHAGSYPHSDLLPHAQWHSAQVRPRAGQDGNGYPMLGAINGGGSNAMLTPSPSHQGFFVVGISTFPKWVMGGL